MTKKHKFNPEKDKDLLQAILQQDTQYVADRKAAYKKFLAARQAEVRPVEKSFSFTQFYANFVSIFVKHTAVAAGVSLLVLGSVSTLAAEILAPEEIKPSTILKINNPILPKVTQETPQEEPPKPTHKNCADFGFFFSIPADWECQKTEDKNLQIVSPLNKLVVTFVREDVEITAQESPGVDTAKVQEQNLEKAQEDLVQTDNGQKVDSNKAQSITNKSGGEVQEVDKKEVVEEVEGESEGQKKIEELEVPLEDGVYFESEHLSLQIYAVQTQEGVETEYLAKGLCGMELCELEGWQVHFQVTPQDDLLTNLEVEKDQWREVLSTFQVNAEDFPDIVQKQEKETYTNQKHSFEFVLPEGYKIISDEIGSKEVEKDSPLMLTLENELEEQVELMLSQESGLAELISQKRIKIDTRNRLTIGELSVEKIIYNYTQKGQQSDQVQETQGVAYLFESNEIYYTWLTEGVSATDCEDGKNCQPDLPDVALVEGILQSFSFTKDVYKIPDSSLELSYPSTWQQKPSGADKVIFDFEEDTQMVLWLDSPTLQKQTEDWKQSDNVRVIERVEVANPQNIPATKVTYEEESKGKIVEMTAYYIENGEQTIQIHSNNQNSSQHLESVFNSLGFQLEVQHVQLLIWWILNDSSSLCVA